MGGRFSHKQMNCKTKEQHLIHRDLLWGLNLMEEEAIGTISLVTLELLGMYFYNAPILLNNKSKAIKLIQSMHNLNADVV